MIASANPGGAAEKIQYFGNPKPPKSKSGGKNEQWKPGTLGVIINQYKRICTINARKTHPNFAWQPRFHDIIIRNDRAFKTISNYIINNHEKWQVRPNWANQPQFYSSLIGMAINGIFAFLNNSNETLSRKKLSIKPYLCVPTIKRSEFNFFASSNTVSTVEP